MQNNTVNEQGRVGARAAKRIALQMPNVSFQVNEAINTLRGNIQLSGFDIKVVAVTSANKHEGKSSLSFLLANSFAGLQKRTLYMDCDIRNSRMIQRYKVNRTVKGLTEYLVGDASINEIICKTENPTLDVIFTGAKAPNPSELFSGEMFQKMLKTMREHYDYVVVDTPPVNAVIDGVLIAKECDGTVLVVESGVTDRRQSQRAKRELEYAGIHVLGAVLNKVGTRRSGYSYGYGYGYGKYGYEEYGYSHETEDARNDGPGSLFKKLCRAKRTGKK